MLGLYVHIPFCQSKCRYCGFNSRPDKSKLIPRYINAALKQLDFLADKFSLLKKPIDTIYFGGGTPSLLEPDEIGRILQAAKNKFLLKDGCGACPEGECEISIEANPNTITTEKANSLKKLGFNRVSLGAQSFDDATLSFLGRLHRENNIFESFRILRNAGFDNINIDLISAIPATTLDNWISSLDKTIALNPEHISVYDFTFEKDSIFEVWRKRGSLKELDEDLQIEMLKVACDNLKEMGFVRYEISNFANPGRECRHNKIYWLGEKYIGIGAGAFSHLGGSRFAMDDAIEDYISTIEAGDFSFKHDDKLSDEKRLREKLAIGLRLIEGVELEKLGTDLRLELGADLVEVGDGRIRLTERGLLLYDEVAAKIV